MKIFGLINVMATLSSFSPDETSIGSVKFKLTMSPCSPQSFNFDVYLGVFSVYVI